MQVRPPNPRAVVVSLVLLAALGFAGAAAGPQEDAARSVPVIENPATPAEGRREIVLEELWRIGAEDEQVLLGVVRAVLADSDGNAYLLDSQLSTVHLFSPEGAYERSLGRAGDGPGECRRPVDIVLLPGDQIGIVESFPGKIIKLDLAGVPQGTIDLGGNDPAAGGFRFVRNARLRGGTFAYFGGELKMEEDGMKPIGVLVSATLEGTERARLLEHTGANIVETRTWVEADEFFIDEYRWDVGPGGAVYAAPHRDRYAIDVYGPDGVMERVITRAYEPYERRAEDREAVEAPNIVIGDETLPIKAEIADYEPCITRLHVTADGELWVLSAHSTRGQPDGILQTYDVFDSEGIYARQAAIVCPGDPETDRLFDIGGGRFVVVRGFVEDFNLSIGEGGESDVADLEETLPLEVICYAAAR